MLLLFCLCSHRYIAYRDFITADILKKEMGLTEMTEESHRSFRQSLRNSPHYEKPSFLSTIIEQPGSFFSRSSTFTRTVSSEKVLSMTSPVNILAAIGESDG